ncbi:hypothetical protein JCM4914_45190 [Streptomyces platensis subsp. malvinus]
MTAVPADPTVLHPMPGLTAHLRTIMSGTVDDVAAAAPEP